ncbi:P-loop containing nucleoside triphosphate hydrolase protein [Trametes meyenii]|nr:P-loop containing nucleoside triphosphate hydrolase protein [Trametes meyenii]
MYRSLFKFGVFNAVQSQCYNTVVDTNENMVYLPPTGSGKTVLFELAIIKMLKENSSNHDKARCVYIAPTKSLCTEKASSWQTKFTPFGAKCSELTGDTVHSGRGAWGDAKDATIIHNGQSPSYTSVCFTESRWQGEKWDSLTRNWQDHSHVLSQIQLFLIDEVHLLNESRGSTLEVVVSRMKLRGSAVRFVVVSATVPNIEDVADWIGNHSNNGRAVVKEFGEEFRPCQLSKFVYGVPRRKDSNDFVFAKALDYRLYGILQQHCNNKPVLVFCPTRKGVMIAAEHVLKEYEEAINKKENLPWSKPSQIQHSFSNKQVDKLAAFGIGVHHAGLAREDRTATEQLYLKKAIKILFATSTLAVGVNLPAHTVIIKGVKLFQNNASQEYSDLDVMQMIGRAGRPQFDKEGVAIIMCEQELEAKYKALAQGQTILESSLHVHLPEHLNSEIALGTITDMSSAKEWLHNSFLYRRLQKNPQHYDIRKEGGRTWKERMDDLVADSVKTLKDAEMVQHDEEADGLSSTEYGDIMSKFYIRQATMTLILKLPEKGTVREIVYNKLRSHHDIRYTLKKIEKPSDKVFILIQAILGAINLSDPEYKAGDTQPYTESLPILRHISRIARAVVEVAIMRKAGLLVKNALEVMRCLNAKAWEDRSVVLAEHNISTFAALRKTDPILIEQLLNRKSPFGHDLLATVNQLPQYTIAISEENTTCGKDGVEVELSVECALVRDPKVPKARKVKKQKRWDMTLVLTLTSDNTFIDFRRISTAALSKEARMFEVTAKLTKPSQSIIIYMTSARDLEGLEDIPDFWNMSDDQSEVDQPMCNHTCKDKEKCRHLCCRDGLVKPPPMTKKRIEMLIATNASPQRSPVGVEAPPPLGDGPSLNKPGFKPKPKPRAKDDNKTVPRPDRSLKQLETLHERTGVEKNLQLGGGSRIKLELDDAPQRKPTRKPAPQFDLEFARLGDNCSTSGARPAIDLSDSDDDLPAPGHMFETLQASGIKKAISSDSTDYADPDFDALIAGLPASETGPLFVGSLSDEAPLLSRLPHHSSPATSPAPALADDDEGFTLDDSLFDIIPSTPTLAESSYPSLHESKKHVGTRATLAHEQSITQDIRSKLSPPTGMEVLEDDPLAEFEAWLQSGAVEIGDE